MFKKAGILRSIEKPKSDLQGIVSWSWYDSSHTIVVWHFTNPTDQVMTYVLFRNGYYFGDAYWPIYVANPGFNVKWATSLTPLPSGAVNENGAPIGIVKLPGTPTVLTTGKPASSQFIVTFLFTIGPGQTYEILEGGFSDAMPPEGAQLIPVTPLGLGLFCVGYEPAQVTDWDLQTGTSMQGYSPNPHSISTYEVSVNGPLVAVFNDPISTGACQTTNPNPNPNPSKCAKYFADAATALESGNYDSAIVDILDGIACIMTTASTQDVNKLAHGLWKHILTHIENLI